LSPAYKQFTPSNTEEIQSKSLEPINRHSEKNIYETTDQQKNTSGYLVSKKKVYIENSDYKSKQEEFKSQNHSDHSINASQKPTPIQVPNIHNEESLQHHQSRKVEQKNDRAYQQSSTQTNEENKYNIRYKNDLTYNEEEVSDKKPTSSSGVNSQFLLSTPLNLPNFEWPIKGKILSRFGKTGNKFNEGINIQAPAGTHVIASAAGKVVYIGNNVEGYGNLIIIKHADDIMTAYAHVKDIIVDRGTKVAKGEEIATVGQTGNVSQPQLHFSVRKGKKTINPEEEL